MPHKDYSNPAPSYSWTDIWCWQIVSLAFLVFTGAVLGFAFDFAISWMHFPAALLLIVLAGLWLSRQNRTGLNAKWYAVASQLVFLAFIGLCMLLAGSFLDVTSDGQGYHLNSILHFADGWRGQESLGDLRVDHYPQAAEMAAATLVATTRHPEIGKAWNILLALAAFFCVLSFTMRRLESRRVSVLIAFLVVLNPVVVCQIFSHYLDGQLFCWLVILPIALIRAHEERSHLWSSAALFSLVCLVNTKFTGLPYAVVVSAAVLGWIRFRQGKVARRLTVFCIAGVVLATLCAGYRPYVTNFLQQGTPFYPVIPKDGGYRASDFFFSGSMPLEFMHQNRVYKTLISLLARSSNPVPGNGGTYEGNALPRVKLPFRFDPGEIAAFAAPDVRIGGFGPLFSGALTLSFLGLIASSGRKTAFLWTCMAAIVLTVFMLPEGGWWARIVPQIWLFPVLALVACLMMGSGLCRWLSIFLTCTLFANILLVSFAYSGAQVLYSRALREQLDQLRRAAAVGPVYVYFQKYPSNAHRLNRAGIHYQERNEAPCKNPVPLLSFGTADSKTLVCVEVPNRKVSDTPAQNLLRKLQRTP